MKAQIMTATLHADDTPDPHPRLDVAEEVNNRPKHRAHRRALHAGHIRGPPNMRASVGVSETIDRFIYASRLHATFSRWRGTDHLTVRGR